MKHKLIFMMVCLWSLLCSPEIPFAAQQSIETPDLEILHEDHSRSIAEEVIRVYPEVKEELKKSLSWETDFKPRIILLRDRNAFVKAAGSEIVLAFAVPRQYLIVLDTSRVYAKPFTLKTTLKHEMCHLLLHHYIHDVNLPRWLEEGICQWASSGISELMAVNGSSALSKAITADMVMSMKEIETFPEDDASLILAYEQSKSLIEYMISNYGRDSMIKVLTYMREGHTADESIRTGISVSLPEIEGRWHTHLRGRYSWFSYLSNNLYGILFLLGGVITNYGFIRFLRKKKAYTDDEEGDAL
jgi:hypothetical protein